jgi:two-component system chemotaxis response regulator CheB
MSYSAVVIGASAGGFYALGKLLTKLPKKFSMPIFIVQHISSSSDNYMAKYLDKRSKLTIKEADEKEIIKGGVVYIAPPNYHLLIEEDNTLSLSTEKKKNYSRPSIDILFESALFVYGSNLIGVVLTGANNDGAYGLQKIKKMGGYCIVQNPAEAESTAMPLAAIEKAEPQKVLKLADIAELLIKLDKKKKSSSKR